jgi:hypothetical protein
MIDSSGGRRVPDAAGTEIIVAVGTEMIGAAKSGRDARAPVSYRNMIDSSAVFDASGRYRYRLSRQWAKGGESVAFVMLNPSTADHEHNDPTIRRCIGLAQLWGFSALHVVNLFALRATEPATLRRARNPVGRQNNSYIEATVEEANQIVLAWGNHGQLRERNSEVLDLLSGYDLFCLGCNLSGQPKHPLYVPRNSSLFHFRNNNTGTSAGA